MCGSSIIVDGLDHPVVGTLDNTKVDGTYPCILGWAVVIIHKNLKL